ncbi:uncharacterized protein LOC125025488 [Penaeus chinensis]|uniref:uncharacterized protein LOC125025488 n=1 Tax=Penaeus chinensis TaxID=139456 RepID=UPI001FB5BDE9|nr:uncharacterized protein LOC125025488 [Penaeus chinensis]
MKFILVAVFACVAAAAPQGYEAPAQSRRDSDEVPILRDDRVIENDGRYNFDVETGDGIVVSESGAPSADGGINSAGSYSYTAPDGTPVHVEFVADEKGFQPQSDLLPVAPEFPHPIPDFVLDQIAFAAEEDARRAKEPSNRYRISCSNDAKLDEEEIEDDSEIEVTRVDDCQWFGIDGISTKPVSMSFVSKGDDIEDEGEKMNRNEATSMRVKESHRVPTFMEHLTWHWASRRDICRYEASGSMAVDQGGTSVASHFEEHQFFTVSNNMKFVVLALLAAVATAVPVYDGSQARFDSGEVVAILRDDRVIEDDGRYNFDMEAGNGIVMSESGSPGLEGAIVSAGSYSYTAPDGTPVVVKYVADENGFQPQSDLLPVAPEFPHPIPQFVLDQIAFAAEEDARRAKEPSSRYGAPQ